MGYTVAKRLQMFGVDKRQAHIYLALLNQGPKTLGQIIRLTDTSRDVVDALNGLRDKGMIKESSDRPPKYSALPIEAALNAAVMKQAYDLRRMELSKQEVVDLVNSGRPEFASDRK